MADKNNKNESPDEFHGFNYTNEAYAYAKLLLCTAILKDKNYNLKKLPEVATNIELSLKRNWS